MYHSAIKTKIMQFPTFISAYALLGFNLLQTGFCLNFSSTDDVVRYFPVCSQGCARLFVASALSRCGLQPSSPAKSQLLCICLDNDGLVANATSDCVVQSCSPGEQDVVVDALNDYVAFCGDLIRSAVCKYSIYPLFLPDGRQFWAGGGC